MTSTNPVRCCETLMTAANAGHLDCVTSLVKAGGADDVNFVAIHDCTSVMLESGLGELRAARDSLAGNGNGNDARDMKHSALAQALHSGHRQCVLQHIDGVIDILSRGAASHDDLSNCAIVCLKEKAVTQQENYDYTTALAEAAGNGHVSCVEALINAGAFVDHASYRHLSALLPAAENGHTECVQDLLAAGADLAITDKYDCTALMLAAQNGSEDCVRTLVGSENLVSTHTPTSKVRALEMAARNGHIGCVKILSGIGIETHTVLHQPALEAAVINGDTDIAKALIELGVNVNFINSFKDPVLKTAAKHGNVECVQALLDGGATVDIMDGRRFTPLMYAAQKGHLDCVQLLLKAGANSRYVSHDQFRALLEEAAHVTHEIPLGPHVNHHKYTPLLMAIQANQPEVAEVLLAAGADVDCVSDDISMPLLIAAQKGHWECLNIVLKYNPKIDVADGRGFTPLMYCAGHGHVESVRALLAAGADINATNNVGQKVIASSLNQIDIVKILLEYIPDIHNCKMRSMPLLHFFIKEGRTDLLEALIERGADLDQVNDAGESPLIFIIRYNTYHGLNTMKFLLRHGSDPNRKGKKHTPLGLAVIARRPLHLKMLWTSGSGYNGYFLWHLSHDMQVMMDSHPKEGQEISQLLHEICCTPRSLRESCRKVVRESLNYMRPITKAFEALPVPDVIKDYLNLSELDDVCDA